jgi:site-specific recombinase XerD
LQKLLEETPTDKRTGWIVNPLLPIPRPGAAPDSFRPAKHDLSQLVQGHTNSAIARACRVSEAAVRRWLAEAGIKRTNERSQTNDVSPTLTAKIRRNAEQSSTKSRTNENERLTKEHVGRIISRIGEQAKIVVQQADDETGKRIKYASAHDLRRGCAQRLINAGVSAETLKIVMRHRDFSTTERFYGATRAAQSAAQEIHQKLSDKANQPTSATRSDALSADEVRKLRTILHSI